jgi:hypothetical protein
MQKKNGCAEVSPTPKPAVAAVKPIPMETEEPTIESSTTTSSSQEQASPVAVVESVETPTKKKGKKKQSYKNMMAGMMHSTTDAGKVEKEKDALRKVTGGGAFSKVDKI